MARAALLSAVGLLLAQAACAARTTTTDAPAGVDVARGSGTPVVDCLLPPQLRKLGPAMPYLAPQRAIKASVEDCAIRGGKAFRVATATAPESASRVASVQVSRSVDPPPRRRAGPRGEGGQGGGSAER